MNYRRTNLLVLIVLMLLSTVGRLTPPLSCNDQVSIHKWGKMDFSCLSVVYNWGVDRTLIDRLKNAKHYIILKTCLLLPPLPHKNVCHPRWMYLWQNIDYFFSSDRNEESYGREQSLFGYSLFFVTYGAGLQKRLSAGLLCARMRRAIGKSGRECIISPKLPRGAWG